MKQYDKYKSSGIDWIGKIPEHWDVIKLKYVGETIIGIIYSPAELSDRENGVLVLRASNIQNGILTFDDCVYVKKDIQKKHFTQKEDIILCARSGSAHLIGKCVLIAEEHKGLTFGAFMVVVRSQMARFLYLFFNSTIFKSQTGLFSTSTINQLTSDTLNNMIIAYPADGTEQTAIANFLDGKTAKIDSLIEKKKKLVKLLKEERTAVVNQAVTRGIDPHVKLKPSGIDWLGDIPEHWEVKKLKYVLKITKGALKPGPFGSDLKNSDLTQNGHYKVYTQGNIIENNFEIGEDFISDDKFESLKAFEIFENDILLTSRGTIGRAAIFPKQCRRGILHPCLIRLQIDSSKMLNKWLIFYFNESSYFIENVKLNSNSTVIDVIYGYTLRDILIPLPPNDEQDQIVQHIETETKRIDGTISKIEKEIELLGDYRTALISEVVTGKIKVI